MGCSFNGFIICSSKVTCFDSWFIIYNYLAFGTKSDNFNVRLEQLY